MLRLLNRFRMVFKDGEEMRLPKNWPEFERACRKNNVDALRWEMPVDSWQCRFDDRLYVYVTPDLPGFEAARRGLYEVARAYLLRKGYLDKDAIFVAWETIDGVWGT